MTNPLHNIVNDSLDQDHGIRTDPPAWLSDAAATFDVDPTIADVAAAAFQQITGRTVVGMHGLYWLGETLLAMADAPRPILHTEVDALVRTQFDSAFPPPLPDSPGRLGSVEEVEAMFDAQFTYPLKAARDLTGETSHVSPIIASLLAGENVDNAAADLLWEWMILAATATISGVDAAAVAHRTTPTP